MKPTFLAAGAVLLATATIPLTASAADPKFEFGKAEEAKTAAEKPVEWAAQAQAGFTITSGNADTSVFSAGASASRKAGDNKLSLELAAAYGQSDLKVVVDADGDNLADENEIQTVEQNTTNSLFAKGRYDRFLSPQNSLFAAASVGRDEPAGKKVVGGGQLGYSRLLLKLPAHELAGEAGYDFSYEAYVADTKALAIHSSRLFVGYTGKLTDVTALTASLEWLANLNPEDDAPVDDNDDGNADGDGVGAFGDNRLLGKLALTTKLTSAVSFRFGFTLKYDSAPAPLPNVPGSGGYDGFTPLAEATDTVTEAQLIVNLL